MSGTWGYKPLAVHKVKESLMANKAIALPKGTKLSELQKLIEQYPDATFGDYTRINLGVAYPERHPHEVDPAYFDLDQAVKSAEFMGLEAPDAIKKRDAACKEAQRLNRKHSAKVDAEWYAEIEAIKSDIPSAQGRVYETGA